MNPDRFILSRQLIGQQMTVLAPHGSDIADLFALSRGYDPQFAELLQRE